MFNAHKNDIFLNSNESTICQITKAESPKISRKKKKEKIAEAKQNI